MYRGLILSPFNRDLVVEAFDAIGAVPTDLYMTRRTSDDFGYPVVACRSKDFVRAAMTAIETKSLNFIIANSTSDYYSQIHSQADQLAIDARITYVGHPSQVVELFVDKVATKQLCRTSGIDTPRWTSDRSELAELRKKAFSGIVCKKLRGMSGNGQFILRELPSSSADLGEYFFEELVEGFEFSASLLYLPPHAFHFPILVKGMTGADGLHALDKPRFIARSCPARFEDYVRRQCLTIGEASGARGWLDCEFILNSESLKLIEVNGRYSGCVRACNFATDVNPYALHLQSALGIRHDHLPKQNDDIVVELPLLREYTHGGDGRAFVQGSKSRANNFGRVTARGRTVDEIEKQLLQIQIDPSPLDGVFNQMSAFGTMVRQFSINTGLHSHP